MKSGLEGRNNSIAAVQSFPILFVSMKSGLEGRNNADEADLACVGSSEVSMKSGLEGRNNSTRDPRRELSPRVSQ